MTAEPLERLLGEIRACRACEAAFASTRTAHEPRPVVQASSTARLLVVGQAPGMRVHRSGRPFDDASGDRLRFWMGVDRTTFYDAARVMIAPMAFCFPGYDAAGADLPPPKRCARLWRARMLAAAPRIEFALYVGAHAQRWARPELARGGMTETVRRWRDWLPTALPTPHPSWRNTGWLRRNGWFEAEIVPALRVEVAKRL